MRICVVPSGTDSRFNNPHADETWLCGRWRHRRWSKGLEAFAWEVSECRHADGDFGGTTCSTAAWGLWGFGYLVHQRTGIAHKATISTGSSLRDPFQCLGPQWSSIKYESFVSTRQRTSQSWRKRLQNFHESTAHRHREQSGSVALAVKRDFKNEPKNCRRKETARKYGEKSHLDSECKRQRNGGRHESVAMGLTLAAPDAEHWAALTHWKTAGVLVDTGCTDHIVTNTNAFLDFVPIQSVVRKPNGEASRVVGRGCVTISIHSNKEEFQFKFNNNFCVPDYSSNLLSVSRCTEWGQRFNFLKRKYLHETPEGTSRTQNTRK